MTDFLSTDFTDFNGFLRLRFSYGFTNLTDFYDYVLSTNLRILRINGFLRLHLIYGFNGFLRLRFSYGFTNLTDLTDFYDYVLSTDLRI
ncbi:MAG: hypothetical protein U5L45_01205 [Saprospiraceae bacterium]|nr:hypothetical protein [Saprospiraceae bacterium]